MFRFHSAGESHGPCLTVIVEGVPAGVKISTEEVDAQLARRQVGYGRGGRMRIERDSVEFVGGVRWGRTTGAPVAMLIRNRDWENWREGMSASADHAGSIEALTRVRPGHADFPGALKYARSDARDILERSSARETASRVAAGALAKAALGAFEIGIGSFVESIGSVSCGFDGDFMGSHLAAEVSDVRMADQDVSLLARGEIDRAKATGDTLGGVFVCFAEGLPVGLGSHVAWDRRLDGRIAGAIVSIPAIKGVEFGMGFSAAVAPGSKVHDRIFRGGSSDVRRGGVRRTTNNAGGLEGGMTNGEVLWLKAAMKPIPTLMSPLETVDLLTGEPLKASTERSDTCAVAAASVVGEAMLALELADAFFEKFGGDSLEDASSSFAAYLGRLGSRW